MRGLEGHNHSKDQVRSEINRSALFSGKTKILVKTGVLVALVFFSASCKGKLKTTKGFDISDYPFQVVDDMFIIQTDKGVLQMRSEAPRMERYHSDTLDYDIFPEGFSAYGYTEDGQLETEIKADRARHLHPKSGGESWEAYGNVSVKNLINRETMETDTLYWDREKERIYTHSYVRLYSPKGFMQGYGMESDQRARSSIIKRPFNSYGIMDNDSTKIEIDSVNFIGPLSRN